MKKCSRRDLTCLLVHTGGAYLALNDIDSCVCEWASALRVNDERPSWRLWLSINPIIRIIRTASKDRRDLFISNLSGRLNWHSRDPGALSNFLNVIDTHLPRDLAQTAGVPSKVILEAQDILLFPDNLSDEYTHWRHSSDAEQRWQRKDTVSGWDTSATREIVDWARISYECVGLNPPRWPKDEDDHGRVSSSRLSLSFGTIVVCTLFLSVVTLLKMTIR
jgi:hypothetical protein